MVGSTTERVKALMSDGDSPFHTGVGLATVSAVVEICGSAFSSLMNWN